VERRRRAGIEESARDAPSPGEGECGVGLEEGGSDSRRQAGVGGAGSDARADEIRRNIAELANADLPEGLDPGMRDMQLEALRSVLADLEAELADYDTLHDTTLFEAIGLGQLPLTLIRPRIARGTAER
jgi:ribosomal protein L29